MIYLQSKNFKTGDTGIGWRIMENGEAEFGTLTLQYEVKEGKDDDKGYRTRHKR